METKKEAKFRIIAKDLETKETKTFTLYKNEKPMTFVQFIEKLVKKIEEL